MFKREFFPTELKGEHGWTKHKFACDSDASLDELMKKDNVARVDVRQISQDDFVEKFDIPKIPVVLTHIQDHWMAKKKWSKEVYCNFFFTKITMKNVFAG